MSEVLSWVAFPVLTSSSPASSARCGSRVAAARWSVSGSCGLWRRGQRFGEPFEIEDPADQMGFLPHTVQPTPSEAPEPMPVLPLAKEFLDQLAAPLRQSIPEPALPHSHAHVGGRAPAGLGGDARFDPPPAHDVDQLFLEEPSSSP